MKKNILTALFALLTVALNSNAQNNTYNMVIEMANGTKINIGPNDVKNISFNNGELVMTGEDINSLVEKQNKTEERLDSLADVHRILYIELYNEMAMYWAFSSTKIQELSNRIDAIQKNILDSANTIAPETGESYTYSTNILGSANIIDPETGEPYTFSKDFSSDRRGTPWKMSSVVKVIEEHQYMISFYNTMIYALEHEIEELRNQLKNE